ncbi:MAG: MMPL family transporter [Candidatus Heimdallarchaeaceae archaeon]
MAFIKTYHKFLEKSKFIIIAAWVVLLAFGIWLGPKFLDETSSNFDPPEGSPADLATKALKEDFPIYANKTSVIFIIRTSNENESVINNETKQIHDIIIEKVNEFSHQEIILSIVSYYILLDANFSLAAQSLVSPGNESTIINVDLNYEVNKELTGSFIRYMKAELQEIEGTIDDEAISIYITGFIVMYLDMKDSAQADLQRMDVIVIPIALIVLGFVLKSIRLMLLPIFSMGISILTAFLIMYPLAKIWTVFSFVPSIMMSLVIAMSIDYSLFLLTRYREELIKKKTNQKAVELMSEHAGHTIFVSGTTLAITFLGLVFFPIELLSSIGVGAAIAIVATLLVNLTLTPAILLVFGGFFSKFTLYKKISKNIPETEEEIKKFELESQLKSFWYKLSKFSTKYAKFVILAIFLIAIPVSIQVFQFDRSIDFLQILPRNSDSSLAYKTLSDDFSPGEILPFYLVIRTHEVNGTLNPEFFSNTINLLSEITNKTLLTNESYISIVRAGDFWIPFTFAYPFLDPSSPVYDTEFGRLYRVIFDRYTNEDNSTTMVEIQTSFDPFGDYSEDWVKQTRVIIKDFEEKTGYEIHLAEGSTSMVDAIDRVYELFPIMISITIIVVYILIAIMFKSAFIPLRLIITVGLTLSWIYGLTIMVFKTAFFARLFPVLDDVQTLYWLTPVMSFSILIGLALDYDIFLLSRISEFRNLGFTDEAAIHKGLFKTGNIISFAGIIMAIAFSGLLLGREMVLNQFGFMLCFAVLIDTFVIRTVLVPAIMVIAQKWNWWPSKKPEPTKDETVLE